MVKPTTEELVVAKLEGRRLATWQIPFDAPLAWWHTELLVEVVWQIGSTSGVIQVDSPDKSVQRAWTTDLTVW